jgi:hypothetical protein
LAEFVEKHELGHVFVHRAHALSVHVVPADVKTVHATTVHALKSPVETMLLKKTKKMLLVEQSSLHQKHHDQKRVHLRRAPWQKAFR